jgi:hypothetical protein
VFTFATFFLPIGKKNFEARNFKKYIVLRVLKTIADLIGIKDKSTWFEPLARIGPHQNPRFFNRGFFIS